MDPPTSRNTRSWDSASLGECGLLAQALIATDFQTHPLPLMIKSGRSGACNWRQLGLAPELVTSSEFQTSVQRDDMLGYIPHISLTAPRYSTLHLRAAVGVERLYHWEAARGETCWFTRGMRGWRLDACRPTSVS